MSMVHLGLGGGRVLGKTTLKLLLRTPTPHPSSGALAGFGPVNKPFKAFNPEGSASLDVGSTHGSAIAQNSSTPTC